MENTLVCACVCACVHARAHAHKGGIYSCKYFIYISRGTLQPRGFQLLTKHLHFVKRFCKWLILIVVTFNKILNALKYFVKRLFHAISSYI